MVSKATLIRQMRKVSQDVTVIDRVLAKDTYGRLNDIAGTPRTIKMFIDYSQKASLTGQGGGSLQNGSATCWTDSDEILKIKPPTLITDKYGDTWTVKGQGQPIQNSQNIDIFRQWSISLTKTNGNS